MDTHHSAEARAHEPVAPVAAWRVMWGYVRPHRKALVVGGVLSLFTGATGLALPLAVRWMIDNFATGGDIGGVLMLMAGLVVANAGIGALGSYVLQRTAESVVLTARQRLTSRLLRLRLTAVEQTEPGDLMARVTSDTTLLRQVTTQSLVSVITATLMLIATVALMGLLDVVLLTVTLVVLAVAGGVIGVVVPRINRAAAQAQESVGDIGSALERALGAFRTIKASGAEEREESRLHSAAESAWQAQVRSAVWNAVAGNTAGLAAQVAFIVVLAVGGARAAAGAIEISTLVAFLLYVYYLMPPVTELAGAVGQYQVGKAAVDRIQAAEDLPVEVLGPVPEVPHRKPAGVSFDDVHFRYGPELPWVHHGVTFDASPLGMTAFVGPSGAGKTTVFSLIERFYEPERGRVSVDGRDVMDWTLADLRAAIGYVEQDAPVLSGTVRENLVFGAPNATEGEIQKVLADTRLAGLVSHLPHGLDTMVGHRGFKLSGGERQRVAIGRALLRGPRLLLLDEVTSQLDAVNEAALRDTVANAARTTTVLVVAHRLSTVMMADRIVVMDAGRVRAVGTHAELVASDPLYGELAATQFLATAN